MTTSVQRPGARSHVSFAGLWSMAIDVPYSYLLRDEGLAWTCGQLSLDLDSNVVHPGDLEGQSLVVCDHVSAILERAQLSTDGLRRLYLYHCTPDQFARNAMLETFRDRFGPTVLLDAIPVPHFYYDGVLLEVDVWWAESDEMRWVAAVNPESNTQRFSEHLIVPTAQLPSVASLPDTGAAIDGGPDLDEPMFLSIELPGESVTTEVETGGTVTTVLRQSGPFTWLQGRSTNGQADLVEQTEAVMRRFDATLESLGLCYADVVKSTTHYVGGSSADELHDNMAVRNRRYAKPGPASTGLPVFGFADPASKVVIDITLVRR